MRPFGALALGTLALGLASAGPVSAATFTVTGVADSTGACAASVCPSLRAAVSAANSMAGVDEIQLQAGTFLITLGSGTAENANASGDLDVTGSLTIRGAGANATTIKGALPADQGERDIHVPANPSLTLSDLSVAGGRGGENESFALGGGIFSAGAGTLTLERVVVRDNEARGKASFGDGGGIALSGNGRLVMRDSAVLNNGAFAAGYGGGIYLGGASATSDLTNVTIAGNTASSSGGGIESDAGGLGTLAYVTVMANEALGSGGGGIGNAGGLHLQNSIVDGNSAPGGTTNCVQTPASEGGNVADPACGLNQASDAATLDAMLGPLACSPIPVFEPLAGSPALDRAVAPCPPADARGVARPQGPACDAGAAERPVAVAPVPSAPVIADARQARRTWRIGKKLPTFARRRRPPVGTTFSLGLDQEARVSFVFTQRRPGRRVNGRCVAPRPKNRRRHACKRTVTRGRLSFAGHAGTNKVSFQGRISRSKRLRPGRYKLVISATNAAGLRSSSTSLRFRIVR